MDTSNGFPPKASLTADVFYEVTSNFLLLLALIADDVTVQCFTEHHQFCMTCDTFTSNFQAVLNFDIKTRRRFFNNHVFLDHVTYKEHWTEVKIDSCMDHDRGGPGNGEGWYNPYSPQKPNGPTGAGSSGDGKPFRRGKGVNSTDHLLCVICGRNGHKLTGCMHTQTIKGSPPVSMCHEGKIVLKATKEIVCISYNLGKCPVRHGPEILHVCSQYGSKSHAIASKSC
ncbi:hypothetical protein EDB19DRAFT_1916691 [Suillus lakei]|nr:hypothetical protein EDB19DRAFT_1916691 [Suillus lakei]